MQEDLIKKIANLMTEQATAFTSLDSLTKQLIVALVRSEPNNIESLSRTGETELMRMRARLLEITTTLTAVGLASPPSWLKPYPVLSNGEKFRCDLAMALLQSAECRVQSSG
ncbi:MAG: hypothetical protein ABJA66_01000, partial [Actinomycetota bacterium]